jgi:hypothetical protein
MVSAKKNADRLLHDICCHEIQQQWNTDKRSNIEITLVLSETSLSNRSTSGDSDNLEHGWRIACLVNQRHFQIEADGSVPCGPSHEQKTSHGGVEIQPSQAPLPAKKKSHHLKKRKP